MAQEIVDISGHQVVFGLAWRKLTETMSSEKKEIRIIAASEKAKQSAILHKRGVFCGLALEGLPKGVVYSGAILLANAGLGDNCIFVYQIEDDLFAVVGLRDGVPVTGMDFVADHATTVAKSSDFIAHSGEVAISAYSNCDFFTDGKQFDLEALDPASVTAAKLVKVGADWSVPILVVLVIASMTFGWFWYEDYQAEQKRKAQRQNQVDPVAQYLASASAILVSELTQPARTTGETYLGILGNLPATRAGWRVAGAYCQNAQCIISWAQIPGGTNQSFAEGANISELTFKPDGKGIEQAHPVVFPAPSQAVTLETLKQAQTFSVEAGSLFQTAALAGVQGAMGGAEIYGLAPGAERPQMVPGGFLGRGAWTLQGPYALIRELLSEMPENMTLNALRFTADQTNPLQLTLQAEGYFYVRK